jgi:hypothetical protein
MARALGLAGNVIAAIDCAVDQQGLPTTSRSSTCRWARRCCSRGATTRSTRPSTRAFRAGIVVVASAGNRGKTADGRPLFGAIHGPGQFALLPSQ